ncbi:MAG: AzlD domain-containing protein, partial [Acidimicrobiia bacterium]
VAPAVLAALTVPAIVGPSGHFDPWNAFLPAAIAGGLARWRTSSIGAGIVVGLPTLLLIESLIRVSA